MPQPDVAAQGSSNAPAVGGDAGAVATAAVSATEPLQPSTVAMVSPATPAFEDALTSAAVATSAPAAAPDAAAPVAGTPRAGGHRPGRRTRQRRRSAAGDAPDRPRDRQPLRRRRPRQTRRAPAGGRRRTRCDRRSPRSPRRPRRTRDRPQRPSLAATTATAAAPAAIASAPPAGAGSASGHDNRAAAESRDGAAPAARVRGVRRPHRTPARRATDRRTARLVALPAARRGRRFVSRAPGPARRASGVAGIDSGSAEIVERAAAPAPAGFGAGLAAGFGAAGDTMLRAVDVPAAARFEQTLSSVDPDVRNLQAMVRTVRLFTAGGGAHEVRLTLEPEHLGHVGPDRARRAGERQRALPGRDAGGAALDRDPPAGTARRPAGAGPGGQGRRRDHRSGRAPRAPPGRAARPSRLAPAARARPRAPTQPRFEVAASCSGPPASRPSHRRRPEAIGRRAAGFKQPEKVSGRRHFSRVAGRPTGIRAARAPAEVRRKCRAVSCTRVQPRVPVSPLQYGRASRSTVCATRERRPVTHVTRSRGSRGGPQT